VKHVLLTASVLVLLSSALALPLYRDSLDNGLVVLTYEDPRLPAVDVRLVCRSGSSRDPEGQSGTANLANLLLLHGTKSMTDDSVAAVIEFLGARHNSATSHDFSYVEFKTLSEHLDLVLDLLTDGVLHPSYDSSVFERERQRVLAAARRQYDSPGRLSMMELDRLLFEDGPYARPALGETLDLQGLTPSVLRDFHAANYVPNNCYVVAVGDVRRDDIVNRLNARFGGWKARSIADGLGEVPRFPQGLRAKLIHREDLNQSYVTMGHPGISIHHPDMLSTRLMSFVLGGSAVGSRLGESVREKGGLAYDVRCWYDRRSFTGAFRSTVQTANPALAISKMLDQFRAIQDSTPTAEELATAQSYYTGSFPISYSSSRGKLRHVTIAEAYRLGTDWLERFPEKVSELATGDLARSARERLQPDSLYVVIVGNVTRDDFDLPGLVWLD
jgi:zinc protease